MFTLINSEGVPEKDKETSGVRQRNVANGGPTATKEDDANSNQPDSFAGDLVFDIQTLTSVQTDFRYAN